MEASLIVAMQVTLVCLTWEAAEATRIVRGVASASTCDGTKNWAKEGKVSASSVYSSAVPADLVFLGGKITALELAKMKRREQASDKKWRSGPGMPPWIDFELNNPKAICKISFRTLGNNSKKNKAIHCPKSFKFQGSNDNKTFTDLFTLTDAVERTCNPDKVFAESFANEKAFKFYRLFLLDVPGRKNGRKYVILRDIQFFSTSQNDLKISSKKTNQGPCYDKCYEKRDEVCASDGKTYKNYCKFLIAECKAKNKGQKLEKISDGRCKNQLGEKEKVLLGKGFSQLDKDANGEISIEELGTGMRLFNKTMTKNELQHDLKKWDADDDGSVNYPEFLAAMAKRMAKTEKNRRYWFQLIDMNGDGVIKANEWRSYRSFLGLEISDYGDFTISYNDFTIDICENV